MDLVELPHGWAAVLTLEIEDVDLHGNLDAAVDLGQAADAIARFVWLPRRTPHLLVRTYPLASRKWTRAFGPPGAIQDGGGRLRV
jgi:hypothetical protein